MSVAVVSLMFNFWPQKAALAVQAPVPVVAPDPYKVTHAQDTWIRALEWCESSGVETAVNKKDLDGTPSYYSFQFKPDTLKSYGIKYGVIPASIDEATFLQDDLGNYDIQIKVVEMMVKDPTVKWTTQFPDCVKNHIGFPPKA